MWPRAVRRLPTPSHDGHFTAATDSDPGARAVAARRLADHRQMELPAVGRLLERQRQRLRAGPCPRSSGPDRTGSSAQDVGKQVAERRLLIREDRRREIEPLEARRLPLDDRRLVADHRRIADVDPGSLSVAYASAISRKRTRGPLVARIHVRVEAPRQPAVGLLDLQHRRATIDPEHDVEVHRLLLVHDLRVDDAVGLTRSAGRQAPIAAPDRCPAPRPGRRPARRSRDTSPRPPCAAPASASSRPCFIAATSFFSIAAFSVVTAASIVRPRARPAACRRCRFTNFSAA